MPFPLENARLCMDCDTVFSEPRCPGCDSESYFPLSRWVRPANEAPQQSPRNIVRKARTTSLVLGGAGVAYALWKILYQSDKSHSEKKPAQGKVSPPKKKK